MVVMLHGCVGRQALIGLNGFFTGPVIAAMFMAAWYLFARAREADGAEPPKAW